MFRPSSDPYKIKERLAETTEAVAVITAKGALPVGQLYDIENALHFCPQGRQPDDEAAAAGPI